MRRILLVGASEVSELGTGLQAVDFEVVTAKAFDDSIRGPFDAIVLDSGRIGADVVKEVLATRLPVIVIGTYEQLRSVADLDGIAWAIEKPVNASTLARALVAIWEPPSFAGIAEKAFDVRGLTSKEREVARLVLRGLSTRRMAELISNTEKTIKHHISAIFQKFDVDSRAELFHRIFPT